MQALGLVWGDVNANAAGFQEVFTVMREPSHYDARHLFVCWRERNDEGGFVIGKDVPSRALARVMSHLVVYEPLDGGRDFRARLAGTSLLRRFGRDISGSKLSELDFLLEPRPIRVGQPTSSAGRCGEKQRRREHKDATSARQT